MNDVVQQLIGTPVHEEWALDSYYAKVSCVRTNTGERFVVKVIMPDHMDALHNGSRAAAAELMNQTVCVYRAGLHACGVSLAEPYQCFVHEGHVIHISPYVGLSVDAVLNASEADALEILTAVLTEVRRVIEQEDPRRVGIDARLSNFCVGDDAQVVFVDTFPAICRVEDEIYTHWPNPTDPGVATKEYARKFDPHGILRRLRFDTLRHDLALEEVFEEAAKVAFEGASIDPISFFHTLPDRFLGRLTDAEIHELIDGLTPGDTDLSREIGLRLAPEGPWRDTVLKNIFDWSSSFSRHGIPVSERFPRLKDLLHGLVDNRQQEGTDATA